MEPVNVGLPITYTTTIEAPPVVAQHVGARKGCATGEKPILTSWRASDAAMVCRDDISGARDTGSRSDRVTCERRPVGWGCAPLHGRC